MYKNAGKFFNRSRSKEVRYIRAEASKAKKPKVVLNQQVGTATWAKLNDGTWGLRINGYCSPGTKVRVITRDGRTSEQVIGDIIEKSGDCYLCEIATGAAVLAKPVRSNSSSPIYTYAKIPIPIDDGTIPFDGPYRRRRY